MTLYNDDDNDNDGTIIMKLKAWTLVNSEGDYMPQT